jgi:hypothetical protein
MRATVPGSELAVFSRQATRMVREWCGERGQVPALVGLVSRGWSPRRLVADFSLHEHEDRLAARAEVQRMVRENDAKYAAVASRVSLGSDGLWLLLGAVDAHGGLERWAAPVDVGSGLGGWGRQNFEWGERWLFDALAEQAPRFGSGVPIPVSPWDGRERVAWALSGVSMELGALPWDWHPDREPRPTKLMIRDQLRVNDLKAARFAAAVRLSESFLGTPRA